MQTCTLTHSRTHTKTFYILVSFQQLYSLNFYTIPTFFLYTFCLTDVKHLNHFRDASVAIFLKYSHVWFVIILFFFSLSYLISAGLHFLFLRTVISFIKMPDVFILFTFLPQICTQLVDLFITLTQTNLKIVPQVSVKLFCANKIQLKLIAV